jgi:hypothetical protein
VEVGVRAWSLDPRIEEEQHLLHRHQGSRLDDAIRPLISSRREMIEVKEHQRPFQQVEELGGFFGVGLPETLADIKPKGSLRATRGALRIHFIPQRPIGSLAQGSLYQCISHRSAGGAAAAFQEDILLRDAIRRQGDDGSIQG